MIDPRTWWTLRKGAGWQRALQSTVNRVRLVSAGRAGWRAVVGGLIVSGLLPLLAPLFVLGCGGTDPSLPAQKLEDVFWRLELNHHAVLLATTAPWDTLPLTATPVNYRGDTLTGLPAPQYHSDDVEHVQVTPDGVLHAVAPMAPNTEALVIVELTANGVTNADTVYVRVTATTNPPPVLHSFSIHPLPPDSAKRAVDRFGLYLPFAYNAPAVFTARATDPEGNPIPNVPVYYRSSDKTIAKFDVGSGKNAFSGLQPGAVTFYASTTVFGVTKADTLPYRIGQRLDANITRQRIVPVDGGPVRYEFAPSEVRVGTGGLVTWRFPDNLNLPDTALTDVVFAESDLPNVVTPTVLPGTFYINFVCFANNSDCNSGNFSYGQSPNPPVAIRVFTKPGTYEYHSALLGISGRVVVVDDQ